MKDILSDTIDFDAVHSQIGMRGIEPLPYVCVLVTVSLIISIIIVLTYLSWKYDSIAQAFDEKDAMDDEEREDYYVIY